MNEKFTQVFEEKEPKNHSIRWNANDTQSAISTLYIGKSADPAFAKAKKIRITVEVVE
jgi:hypothetical protein